MDRDRINAHLALPAIGLLLFLTLSFAAITWHDTANASETALTGPFPTPAASLSPIPTPSPTCVGISFQWSHYSNPEPIAPADRMSNDPGSQPGLPTNYPSIINIPGADAPETCVIGPIAIDFALSTDRPDDLDILVVDPQGRKSLIISDAGGDSPITGTGYLFRILYPTFPDAFAPPTGYYQPADYAGLAGLEPEGMDDFPNAGGLAQYPVNFGNLVPGGWINTGDWKLYVVDDETGNLNSLPQGWRVSIYKSCAAGGGCASPFPTPTPPTPTPTPTPSLPAPPTATAASNVIPNSFTANWSSSAGATGYRLDVSPDNTFVTFVPGFDNLDVGNVTSRSVTGLNGGLQYFYRVRAYNGVGTSSNSNTISVVTPPACGYIISPTQANFSANAGTGTVHVGAPFQCSWSAVVNNNLAPPDGVLVTDLASDTGTVIAANQDLTEGTPTNWLTITSPPFGSGNGIINYAVAANTTGFPRTKTMTIAGLTFTVNQSNTSPTRNRFDYDGDGRTDFSVFRQSQGAWYLQRSTDGFFGIQFGSSSGKIVPADYDGDGKTDVAAYQPSTGRWSIFNSATSTVTYPVFGVAEDVPTPGDYDGDGRADISVFRPSQGTWYRQNSSNGSFFGMQFGANGDVPTVGDFDGDGKNDIGIWRPSNGDWYNLRSADGSVFGERFGQTGDKIAPADYDGDGKTDIAIYRPSTGLWVIRNSATATYSYFVFGAAGDVPVAGDYDGDGKADIGVWRPSDGTWYVQRSSNGSFIVFPWGQNGDRPTPSAFGN